MSQIPYGYCQCGCGQKTELWKRNDSRRGRICGEPMKYIFGHTVAMCNKRLRTKIPARERFWKFVEVRGPNDCWEWNGSRTPQKYGRFKSDHKSVIASHFAWELTNGPIPKGMDVMHLCDNPPCCNPAHLTIGTRADNILDRVTKNRSARLRGSLNGHALLSENDVLNVRRMYNSGMLHREIAKHFGVSRQTITAILNGRTWKHFNLP